MSVDVPGGDWDRPRCRCISSRKPKLVWVRCIQEALRAKPVSAQPARLAPRVARQTVCSVQQERPALASTLAAAALAAAVSLGAVDAAQADVSGLTPCKDSKQFAKRQKNELKALDKRLKLVGAA